MKISTGITAGIDLALAMIEDEFGEEIAQQTAKQLMIYQRPFCSKRRSSLHCWS